MGGKGWGIEHRWLERGKGIIGQGKIMGKWEGSVEEGVWRGINKAKDICKALGKLTVEASLTMCSLNGAPL